MDKRVLAAMGDPDGLGPCRGDGGCQLVPVCMVGNHQWQFDAALLRPLLDCHPARRLAHHRVWQAARPAVAKRRRWCDDHMAAEGILLTVKRLSQITEINALFGVIAAQLFLRAMKKDRRLVTRLAQQLDHPLRLAERVGPDHVASVRLRRDRGEKAADLGLRVGMLEHR